MGVILLYWIGIRLDAPSWYNALLIIMVIMKIISFGINMYNAGAES